MRTLIDNRQPKQAWKFNPKTFEYSGETEVQPDPNDASNYLIPRGVTTIEPPKTKSGYSIVWDGEKWKSVKAAK